jgi:Glyoxalase superfamily protein
MSRQLPARPSLDHLRNHAKALLRDLKARNPQAKLSDALHAVALEFGFASWPKLKAHVESLRTEAASEPPTSPFSGRWIADVSRSTRHPANQFQRAVISFAITGDTVTITHGFVDESGRRQHGENAIEVDGREHMADNGYGLTCAWRGSHVLETVATRNGEVVGRGTYEVSADGNTLTISAPEQVIVLDRE